MVLDARTDVVDAVIFNQKGEPKRICTHNSNRKTNMEYEWKECSVWFKPES